MKLNFVILLTFISIFSNVFTSDIADDSNDLFSEYYQEATQILKTFTLEQKIGQMFLPTYIPQKADLFIKEYFCSGFVLFAKDFENKTSDIVSNLKRLQSLSIQKIGLAVDEEGGTVNRISKHEDKRKTKFPSPQDLYKEGGIDKIIEIDTEKIKLLQDHFININFAPVADISSNTSSFIYKRTLGQNLSTTCDYIEKDVELYVKKTFTCCTKHFPGYGSTEDSHLNETIDKRPYENFTSYDLKIFEKSIKAKVPMIMVTHNKILCKDPVYPASISQTWHNILRNDYNYSGLIVTDDLSMGAIKAFKGNYAPVIYAVLAGNDLLLTGNFEQDYKDVLDAVKNNTISIEIIDLAVKRVLAWKLKYLGKNKNILMIVLIAIGCLLIIGLSIFLILKFLVYGKKKEDAENEEEPLNDKSVEEN